VVVLGDTARVPVAETVPTVGLIETVVAPVTFQLKVEDEPAVIGEVAVKLVITGTPVWATVIVTGPEVTEPIALVAVMV
jgi:hypothetical protein